MKNIINFKLTSIIIFFIFIVTSISLAQQKNDKGKLVGQELLNTKCSKCHGAERPLGKNKTMEEWQSTVKRMQGKNPDWIKDDDSKEIVWFLASKSIFETKCSKCHGTDRPLGKNKTMEEWQSTVKRMQGKNPDWIKDDEANKIVDYLFTVQAE